MTLNPKSMALLAYAHPDLQKIVRRCAELSTLDFVITETIRTLERQQKLVAAGASKTMRSRHLPNAEGEACAVDLAAVVDGAVRWDWPLYPTLAKSMKAAAADVGVDLEWGGDWIEFKDGPHFQLPWATYP